MTSEFKTEPGLIGYVLIMLIFAAIAGPALANTPYQSVTNQFLRTSTECATSMHGRAPACGSSGHFSTLRFRPFRAQTVQAPTITNKSLSVAYAARRK
jgi:hypothetical protein